MMRTDCYSSSMRGPGSLETVATACHLVICCRFRVCLSRIVKLFDGSYQLTICALKRDEQRVVLWQCLCSCDWRPRVNRRVIDYGEAEGDTPHRLQPISSPSVINGVVSNASREFRSAVQSSAFRQQLNRPFFVEAA